MRYLAQFLQRRLYSYPIFRSDSVVVRRPVYSPNLVSQCLENIRAQMKDAKKPGIFKLLALSNVLQNLPFCNTCDVEFVERKD